MNKNAMRNPMERKNDAMAVGYEIAEKDLVGKSGAGVYTAIAMTLAGRCGYIFTVSYECSINHVPCG